MDRGALALCTWVLGTVRCACCRWLPDSVVELARGAPGAYPGMLRLATSTRRFKFLERRLYQMLCTKLCCAALRCDGGRKFLPTPVRSSHTETRAKPWIKRAGTACACFCRLFRSDQVARAHARWHAGLSQPF